MPANERPGARAPRKTAASRKPPAPAESELDLGVIPPAETGGVEPEASETAPLPVQPEASETAPLPVQPEASATGPLPVEPPTPPWAAAADRPSKTAPRRAEPPVPPWATPAEPPGGPSAAWRLKPDRSVPLVPPRDPSLPRRRFVDGFGPELEPAWLRQRRAGREVVLPQEWTTKSALAASSRLETPRHIALTASDAALAALPLIVGLVLLWLGAGSGQVTFQT